MKLGCAYSSEKNNNDNIKRKRTGKDGML